MSIEVNILLISMLWQRLKVQSYEIYADTGEKVGRNLFLKVTYITSELLGNKTEIIQ